MKIVPENINDSLEELIKIRQKILKNNNIVTKMYIQVSRNNKAKIKNIIVSGVAAG